MTAPSSLVSLLGDATRARPDHTAVEDPERGAAATYRALDALSDRLRDELVRAGVGRGDRVGICGPKSVGTLAAIFGTLKAGAAYVPADAGAPPERNAYIFRDCAVKAVFATAPLAAKLADALGDPHIRSEALALPEEYGPAVLLTLSATDAGHAGGSTESSGLAWESLAYILYTSGSTGRPKGVMHTHGSALSFVDWCSETFAPTGDDRFSSHAPFHFDLSILDIYLPLACAATLVLIGDELGKQPARLAPVISEREITVWYSTPSVLRLLTEFGKADRYDYPRLRLVLFAGEVFPVKHLRALKALWPSPRYFNLYGPTETNVCTFFEVPAEIPQDHTEAFPIGKTCSNDRAMVVGVDGSRAQPGEAGELYVGGGSVMAGYWNLPERTAEAFFRDADGATWYKTGDIVKEAADGNYLFVGRRDRMVKRRGYRVELGEIEAALYRHPSITEAAVIASDDEENGVLVKAFLTWSGGGRPSFVELKRFCAENLPLYMVPDRFSVQTALPKTSTDKVDYQRLKELD